MLPWLGRTGSADLLSGFGGDNSAAADGGGLGDMLTMSPDALRVVGGTGQVRRQGFYFVEGRGCLGTRVLRKCED